MSGRGGGGKRGKREGGGGREGGRRKITINVLYIGGRGEGRDREREGALEWRELMEKCVGEKRVHNLIIFH